MKSRNLRADGFALSGHDACGTGFVADASGRPRADIVPLALQALARLDHRGGMAADGETGDGAGLLTAIPWRLFAKETKRFLGHEREPGTFGVGCLFLPFEPLRRESAVSVVEAGLRRAGLRSFLWRTVAANGAILGRLARLSRPDCAQVFVERPPGLADDDAFEHRLFVARREIESAAYVASLDELYVSSMSHRTILYKALVRGLDLGRYYDDLTDPAFVTPFAVFHNRYSTNTRSSWSMVQPFRLLAHNGEINTIEGNRRWMNAREKAGHAALLGLEPHALMPLLPAGVSDSASLDEALSLLIAAGHAPQDAMSTLVPPAWENSIDLPKEARAFHERAARAMEPWDGPALVCFSDGQVVGAVLDRNGLRPARTLTTTDGLVVVASEAGVLDVEEARVVSRGSLGPGGRITVRVNSQRSQKPPRSLEEQGLSDSPPVFMESWSSEDEGAADAVDLRTLKAFGYTREELQFVLGPMAKNGTEPAGSMGDDTPLACLSEKPRFLYSFLKQRFAQVTNPPIDPLRERLVMSLRISLGASADVFDHRAASPPQIDLESPILRNAFVRSLRNSPDHAVAPLSLLFCSNEGPSEMSRSLDRVLLGAVRAAGSGTSILLLSDYGIDASHAAIPALLATSAVHQRLTREGLRLRTSLVVETAEARDDHQIAALIGFGANAVNPYGAFAAVGRATQESAPELGCAPAQVNYVRAIEKGLLKILSKMGISTLRSYHGAQLFEAIGLGRELIDEHFSGTPWSLDGLVLEDLARDVLRRHEAAFADDIATLEEGGEHRYRRNGEAHAFEPRVVKALHAMIREGTKGAARKYAELVSQRPPLSVRDLLDFRTAARALSIDEVEPKAAIFKRFATSAMSLGSLSPEAHRVLAIAMNRIGGRSNCGEGGEDTKAADPFRANETDTCPDDPNHHVKQVASGRFGVTTQYLIAARELQIKIAQGSKPGEGGQLPAGKVVEHIARLRHSPVGVTLISPPPHHDIYSIEDLAQLIYDLKCVNPLARVSVKLVSGAGIGTIGVGVAKAGADAIVIGGHDGGTGASPLSSIKNAGTPWELGLVDVHRALREEGLRRRVRLQVEGGLKTGHDVVMAAALGADDFGFGSAVLVATGCVMARQCHVNTCPAGIATQREDLREKFRGTPENVIAFFRAIADEVRDVLASLGRRSLAEIVGDASVLEARRFSPELRTPRVSVADLLADASGGAEADDEPLPPPLPARHSDEDVIARLTRGDRGIAPIRHTSSIGNEDRAVGARLAGELTRILRGRELKEGTIRLHYRGTGGQSFGAFAVKGMRLELEGEANDYVGKGLSGGEIVIRPPRTGRRNDQVIAGNTILYGATSGRLFAAGRVGERFAVRLSGAVAVVEGTGQHACEYMTAGTVLILGLTGGNLGAGMSGGLAYVYDPGGSISTRINRELVEVEEVSDEDADWILEALDRHALATGSGLAVDLRKEWRRTLCFMRRVAPRSGPAAHPIPWPKAPLVRTARPAKEAGVLLPSPPAFLFV